MSCRSLQLGKQLSRPALFTAQARLLPGATVLQLAPSLHYRGTRAKSRRLILKRVSPPLNIVTESLDQLLDEEGTLHIASQKGLLDPLKERVKNMQNVMSIKRALPTWNATQFCEEMQKKYRVMNCALANGNLSKLRRVVTEKTYSVR